MGQTWSTPEDIVPLFDKLSIQDDQPLVTIDVQSHSFQFFGINDLLMNLLPLHGNLNGIIADYLWPLVVHDRPHTLISLFWMDNPILVALDSDEPLVFKITGWNKNLMVVKMNNGYQVVQSMDFACRKSVPLGNLKLQIYPQKFVAKSGSNIVSLPLESPVQENA